ncbi:MAG: MFS transporter [Candidatus Marinimicrobia bacterium]|nr:MFS transporter [Candidatus Neomarinimicrobiota bacterium]HJL74307.1 MFS transporter [Candidatus Neomarinimicrobiota bacterium]
MNKRIFITLQIGLISFFMFADQNLMGPNLTLIAEDFGITDVKDQYLGGLIPLVFWILGGSVALFIGYCTDLMSRKNLFALIVFLGEIPCLLSGFADTYTEFFIMRALTGIGIGGIIPLTYSLLGDLYSANERIKVVTLIGLASGMGIAIGQLAAGMMGDSFGWRLPFILFAVPNFILGAVFLFTVQEPKRGQMDHNVKSFRISDFKDFSSLFKIKTNLLVFLQGIFGTIPWGVFSIFMIDYFVVDKGYLRPTATLVITLVGGMALISSLIGGFVGNKLYRKNPKYVPLFCGMSTILGVIPTAFLINAPMRTDQNETMLIVYAACTGLLIAMTAPNMKAILMNVNSPFSRGTVFSLYNFADDLGRGFGPFIIGNIFIYYFGRNMAFNIANAFWFICGCLILLMFWTFPKENRGE